MTRKEYAMLMVSKNWRIRKRLPRITKLAIKSGLISFNWEKELYHYDYNYQLLITKII